MEPSNSTNPYGDESPFSLEVITFSDRAASDTFAFLNSYGIIGLYVSVVLVVGRFLRLMVDKASHRIVYEDMPEVDALVNICDAIYTSRESQDLGSEEALFRLLIQLYRSPEALIVWSKMRQHAE